MALSTVTNIVFDNGQVPFALTDLHGSLDIATVLASEFETTLEPTSQDGIDHLAARQTSPFDGGGINSKTALVFTTGLSFPAPRTASVSVETGPFPIVK